MRGAQPQARAGAIQAVHVSGHRRQLTSSNSSKGTPRPHPPQRQHPPGHAARQAAPAAPSPARRRPCWTPLPLPPASSGAPGQPCSGRRQGCGTADADEKTLLPAAAIDEHSCSCNRHRWQHSPPPPSPPGSGTCPCPVPPPACAPPWRGPGCAHSPPAAGAWWPGSGVRGRWGRSGMGSVPLT
jgi:hypothetical protein